jgi:prolyl-tRNA synthetase
LDAIQQELFDRAQKRYQAIWHKADKFEDFKDTLEKNNGIYQLGWCQDHQCEARLKEIAGSIRCMIESKEIKTCFGCGKPSLGDVIAGRSY